jgi:hypothetical protein
MRSGAYDPGVYAQYTNQHLQQQIEVLQQRLAQIQSQTGISYISIAPSRGLRICLSAHGNGVYGQYSNQDQQHRAQHAYSQYELQLQRQQGIQQERHLQPPYPQTHGSRSPTGKSVQTALQNHF